LTVSAIGSGVAVGGSGVEEAVGVEAGVGEETAAQAESPSARIRVQNIPMFGMRLRIIVPDYIE
jgi:hypothetical protein